MILIKMKSNIIPLKIQNILKPELQRFLDMYLKYRSTDLVLSKFIIIINNYMHSDICNLFSVKQERILKIQYVHE